ncbi:GTPase [Flavobacterium piscisymbiosum]|uniref:50S ribosome-binding GTPase n=1 Tax=Flavobacterium piscisymbiosum TaxID=2893753 RepID=A0ABS8MDJ4_9FLAO|nr:GTPase [Flavobacterium sp. F-30]MCC9063572.1 50S ribosome-binding GTPase [Flavobacterium sp. F-30]
MDNSADLKFNNLSLKLNGIIQKTFLLLNEFEKIGALELLTSKLNITKESSELKVAFVGQYNAGKSTIISALTGRRDIKIDSNVATDVSCDYKWNNIKITDTPGILAGKVEKHDEFTKETLNQTDLIVYVLTSQLFDDVIFENFIDLAYNQNFNEKMLIAINKMSMEKGDFEILKKNYHESVLAVFKERGYDFDFEIVFIDAADYMEGIDEKEEELIQLSNFSNFIETLNSFIEDKGIVQKAFDTPIRIIRGELSQIAFDEVDPNFSLILNKYQNRLLKHKTEIIRESEYLLENLKTKIIEEGYLVSSSIDQISQEDFNVKQSKFNLLLETESTSTMSQIENLIKEKNRLLREEFEEISLDDDVSFYVENLKKDSERKKINPVFNSSSLESKIGLLNTLKQNSDKLISFSGADKAAGIFAKSSEISGSAGHTLVKNIGSTIGFKFKPWQAVRITKNIGNVAKFAGPALAVFSAGIEIYGAVKEEKELKGIAVSKSQMNESFYEIAKEVVLQIKEKFNEYVKENIDNKISEFQEMKLEFVRTNENNSKFQEAIIKLDSEFIDFIELINN